MSGVEVRPATQEDMGEYRRVATVRVTVLNGDQIDMVIPHPVQIIRLAADGQGAYAFLDANAVHARYVRIIQEEKPNDDA